MKSSRIIRATSLFVIPLVSLTACNPATFWEHNAESVLSQIVASIIVGILAAVATYFLRPKLEYWRERRRLKRETKEEKRRARRKAIQRREVENERLQEYLDRVARLYSTTRIFGQSSPVPIDDIYTAVQVLKRPQALRRYGIDQLRDELEQIDASERVSASALLQTSRRRRVLILGKPGAGKTTFLRYMARQAALGRLDKIPIFVTLREWAKSEDDLLTFMTKQFELCDFPNARAYVEHLLEDTDEALVLLDGLDEIRREGSRRDQAIEAIHDFSRHYDRAQILVTCRVAATDFTFERFTYVEIANFDDDQITSFVGRWFYDNPIKRDAFLEELARPEHRGLRELARVPLLLTMLCLVFGTNMAFPQRRAEIYEEALDALLRKWDISRNIRRDEIYRGLSKRRKHQMLAYIATEAFIEGEYLIPQRELEIQIADYLRNLPGADRPDDVAIDGEAVLKAIEAQHGILIERAHRIYSFAHLTFQEYYTARYIVENVTQDTLQWLVTYAPNDRWREIILLTASLLGEADALFEHFFQYLDRLAQSEKELNDFLTWTARKAESVNAGNKTSALRSYYISLALSANRLYELAHVLARSFALNPAVDFLLRLDRAFNLAQNATQPIAIEQIHEFHRKLQYALDQVPYPDLAIDISLHLVSRLTYIPSLIRVLEFALEDACERAREVDTDLHLALQALEAPSNLEEWATDWQDLAGDLQKIMMEYRDIGNSWTFDLDQADIMADYLITANLLIECLDFAYVTDRSAIEERLLLPPGWSEDAEPA